MDLIGWLFRDETDPKYRAMVEQAKSERRARQERSAVRETPQGPLSERMLGVSLDIALPFMKLTETNPDKNVRVLGFLASAVTFFPLLPVWAPILVASVVVGIYEDI